MTNWYPTRAFNNYAPIEDIEIKNLNCHFVIYPFEGQFEIKSIVAWQSVYPAHKRHYNI